MNKLLLLLLLTLLMFFQFSEDTFAQSDSARSIQDKCSKLLEKSQWDSALYYANILEVVTKKESGEISDRNSNILYLIGEIYRVKEDYYAAYKFFKRSTDIFSELRPNITSWALYALGTARVGYMDQYLGATEEAQEYFLKAIELNNTFNFQAENLQIYLQFADLLFNKGEYAKTDSVFTKIQEVLDTLPKSEYVYYLQGSLYNNKAKLLSETGNMQEALKYMRMSLTDQEIAQNQGYDAEYITGCINLAEAFALNGQMDSAWQYCRRAEKSLTEKNRNKFAGQVLKMKAELYQNQKQNTEAIALNKEYIAIADSLPIKPDDFFATKINLGILYTDTKQYRPADSLFRKNIEQLRQAGIEYSFIIQQSLAGLSANLINMKRYDEATDSLVALIRLTFTAMNKNFAGMSEADKLNYRVTLDSYFDLLYTCLYSNTSNATRKITEIFVLELQRKSLVLTSQVQLMNRMRNLKDATALSLFNAWLGNRQILSRQYSIPLNQRFFNIDSLEKSNEILEKKIANSGFKAGFESNSVLPANLFAGEDQPSADIEFIRFTNSAHDRKSAEYAAFVFKKGDSIPAFVHLCSEGALVKLMSSRNRLMSNEQLTQHLYADGKNNTGLLYQLLWQPLKIHLTGCKIINYSPAGLLNNIAFQAISSGNTRLMNNYTFHRFLNLTGAASSDRNSSAPQSVSLWGNMNYDKASYSSMAMQKNSSNAIINPLVNRPASNQAKNVSKSLFRPFQNDEIPGLKKLFASSHINYHSFESAGATEESFKEHAAITEDVLHISTHGFYFPLNENQTNKSLPGNFVTASKNPLFRCGLTFSGANYYWLKGVPKENHEDGILTGYEVAQLDLHHVRLVALSACETGLGDITDNEGNLGLQRAFKLAGVKYLLVSLWQVPAKQTADLFYLFYLNWLKGSSLSEALRKAALTMQQKNYPPYFWAGFVLIE